MLLGEAFHQFVQRSPVALMVNGIIERVFDRDKLEGLFQKHAVLQYTKELTFAQCLHAMSDVVFQKSSSVGAWYKTHQDEVPVTRQALYDKLKHTDLPVPVALVQYAGRELGACLQALKVRPRSLLAGYRLRILDGNHLAGTEHRILELRLHRAAALPGQALVYYDPQYDLITDVFPCEDAHAQERSLLAKVLERMAAGECVLADRNFCTSGFLFGVARRRAFFIIRQHASTLSYELQGERRGVGTDAQGRRVYEQAACLTDPTTGETMIVRRITLALDKPTQRQETEIHLLTNVPAEDADALQIADLYRDRWTIEKAFWHLSQDLQSEINTLGYPKAALFGLCVALTAYNVVALVKGAIAAVWGHAFVREELSMYYLTLEVERVTTGMQIAVGPEEWTIFRTMTTEQFAETLRTVTAQMDLRKYTKSKRGPKKKPPHRISGKRNHHVSTARILALRTRK
jgi:IS4 transposase